MSDVTVLVLSGIIGIISSLAASGMFLFAISRFRPNLEISPVISKRIDDQGNTNYFVKVINRTRSPVINIKTHMSITSPRNVAGGTVYYLHPIKLRTSEMMELAAYDPNDQDAHYAVRFMILGDLDTAWSEAETSRVRFQIYATHSFTGFGKAFERFYYQKRTDLVEGDFKFGDSLEVV
jgi:hypothetical protein